MIDLATGGIVEPTGTLAGVGTDGPEWVIPLRPSDDATSEVIEAASELDKRLPHPLVNANNWGTIADRLDDTMRARLIEFGKQVI